MVDVDNAQGPEVQRASMFLFEGETESSRNETVRGTDRKVRRSGNSPLPIEQLRDVIDDACARAERSDRSGRGTSR